MNATNLTDCKTQCASELGHQVVIVGGGITGMTAAYTLSQAANFKVTLIDSSNRLGGKVFTQRIPFENSQLVVEDGADALFSKKPWAIDLAEELGLGHELIQPEAKEFSMLIEGKLHRVPGGLVTLTYTEPSAVEDAAFLSDEAKRNVLSEYQIPPGLGDDESIASFFRRRYGEEFSRLVAEPLLAGTHGGSPETLSMKSLYPGYFDLERKYGSLAAGMESKNQTGARPTNEPSGKRASTFLSFRNGMRTLVEALSERLGGTEIELNTEIQHIRTQAEGLIVSAVDGREWSAGHVILATPSHHAAKLLADSAPEASSALNAIRHASGAIVTLGYRKSSIEGGLSGTGFLVPYDEPFPLTGGTWTSAKWPGRAPEDVILVRLFLGRRGGLDVDTASEETMINVARNAFEQLFMPKHSSFFQKVQRWKHALPQYEVGHLERLRGIEAALTPMRGLRLAGTSYRGVGIPDCVRQGREVAQSVIKEVNNLS